MNAGKEFPATFGDRVWLVRDGLNNRLWAMRGRLPWIRRFRDLEVRVDYLSEDLTRLARIVEKLAE